MARLSAQPEASNACACHCSMCKMYASHLGMLLCLAWASPIVKGPVLHLMVGRQLDLSCRVQQSIEQWWEAPLLLAVLVRVLGLCLQLREWALQKWGEDPQAWQTWGCWARSLQGVAPCSATAHTLGTKGHGCGAAKGGVVMLTRR